MQRLSRTILCAAALGLAGSAIAQGADAPPPGAIAAQPTEASGALPVNIPEHANFLMASDVKHVQYACQAGKTLDVSYGTVGETSVATIMLDGKLHLFANVISASGARYASGQYVWWNKGDTGFMTDETQPPKHDMIYRDCKETK